MGQFAHCLGKYTPARIFIISQYLKQSTVCDSAVAYSVEVIRWHILSDSHILHLVRLAGCAGGTGDKRRCCCYPGFYDSFSVYTWDKYSPICDMNLQYPWNLVKNNLNFQPNNGSIVLSGPITAQYIIIMMDKQISKTNVKVVTVGEIKAFGLKLKEGFVPMQPPIQWLPLSVEPNLLVDKVKLSAKSWTYFSGGLDLSPYPLEKFHTPDIQAAIRNIINNYGSHFAHRAPCNWKVYKWDGNDTMSMLNYNKIVLAHTGTNVTLLSGSSRMVGDVLSGAKPTAYSVILNVSRAGNFFPVGAYAKAGYSIQVNPQTDFIYNHKEFLRWSWVNSSRSLKVTDSFSSPVGGVIPLAIPDNSIIQIVFENVYRYPWFDIRNQKSIDTWERQQALYPHTPFTMVMGDRMITMLPTSSFLRMNIENIKFSVNYHDNVIKMIHNYRGTVFETEPFMGFVVDEQISMRWGHSGWSGQPMMGHKPWEEYFRDMKLIKSGRYNSIIHEIGHNLQLKMLTFVNGGEVTNELYIPLVHKYLLNISAYNFSVLSETWQVYIGNLVRQWESKIYIGVNLDYYVILGHHFGPGLVGNIPSRKMTDGVILKEESEKIHYWIKWASLESGYDLVPFHRLWHFPIERRTIDATQHLPCFVPEDELTLRVPNLINDILTQSGKNCYRQNTNMVKFNGNIFRGINSVDKQFIFFQPVPRQK
ncbi:hypothetical protein EG68_07760 [Paragonimus skrjabini miyazakii]|uniref:Peptidase M60 domain-containing protein n=1 Tax=Paragonimus skrjabini miyazakii TaxID=59628 RepID=A0A8S9YRS6_9TREM|nr:hypothetical protein EG68_07760 [Paragonimus skrjabini miyazakii]